jgi:hypothetical protein
MRVGLRPFHRDQRGAAPFAADADPLDKAHDGQDDRAPDTDRSVAGDETHGKGRQTGNQQRSDQRNLAPDAVAIMAEECGAERARYKADGIDAEGLQCPDQRVGGREIQFRENQRGNQHIKQEIV